MIKINDWSECKSLLDDGLRYTHREYRDNVFIYINQGPFNYMHVIRQDDPMNADETDWDTNYKSNSLSTMSVKTQTEFEDNSLLPQFIKGTASFGVTTTAVVDIKVPGVFPAETRFIKDGYLFAAPWVPGIYLSKVQVIDIDNKLGAGANYVAKSYIDDAAASANKGWYLWPTGGGVGGEIDIENAGGVGNLLAELYVRVELTKPTANMGPTDVYVNLFWCSKE